MGGEGGLIDAKHFKFKVKYRARIKLYKNRSLTIETWYHSCVPIGSSRIFERVTVRLGNCLWALHNYIIAYF